MSPTVPDQLYPTIASLQFDSFRGFYTPEKQQKNILTFLFSKNRMISMT